MKKFILSVATVLATLPAFAKAPQSVIENFAKADWVVQAIADAKDQGFVIDEEPDVAFLGGGCGFAGCSARYLVTLKVKSANTVNRQTNVIAGVVSTLGSLPAQVEPADFLK